VLTLPGLAGFVLSVGIAVDANVLIFERIREEIDGGKSVRLAIDEGFNHALSAIIDSAVTTILSGAVLYQYGSGPVRGFAVTLIAGVVASLFTALFVSKTFFMLWLQQTRGAKALSI
jgi:preprotein translocase subunit SecD